jgi:hypothetical protein
MTRAWLVAIFAVVLFTLFPTAGLAQAVQHDHQQQASAQAGGTKPEAMMGQMKMGGMEDEMAARKANTTRLNTLLAEIKTSTGDARTTAMAEVIGILLEERAGMQEHCAAMMKK